MRYPWALVLTGPDPHARRMVNRRRFFITALVVTAVLFTGCGSDGSRSGSGSSDDPYGLTTVDWPTTLPRIRSTVVAQPAENAVAAL